MGPLREAFLLDIQRSPGDPAPLLIFADWLADRGEDDLVWRWLAKRDKRPYHRTRYKVESSRGRAVPEE